MRHVYTHVPFCLRRCSYCDFAIAVRPRLPATAFLEAIGSEIVLRGRELDDREALETIYVGGGTPSLLPPRDLSRLVRAVAAAASGDHGPQHPVEITVEANPEDVTPEAAATWIAAGVNRVSLGVQSFDESVLQWMHRSHGADTPARAVRALREAGCESLSLDVIFGVPEGLGTGVAEDLRRALDLEPDHLSVYGLTVEPRTPLSRWVARGSVRLVSPGRFAEEFVYADAFLSDGGFEHYEVSNYARPGHRARHNAAYWTGDPYLGLGPAAHSNSRTARRWNLREWADYERVVKAGRDPVAGREAPSAEARLLERVLLGLRTVEGIGSDLAACIPDRVWEEADRYGWVRERNERVSLTPQGWLRMDEIAALTTPADGG